MTEEPYEMLDRIPLEDQYELQLRIDLDYRGLPDHLNQDITNMSGEDSRKIMGYNHYEPLE